MANVNILKNHRDYTVAWISALPIERAAATMMLDERHLQPQDFRQASTDTNTYTWGRIMEHNVVITSLSSGVYGTTVAATTATQMLSSLPSIRFGLLVGIGAGVPRKHADVRLGDIVVSQPSGNTGGVFQYDLGKTGTSWQRRDFLNRPPEVLLKALGNLQAEHEMSDPLFTAFFDEAATRNTKWGRLYSRPAMETDRLFDARTEHIGTALDCSACGGELPREKRALCIPHVHYGTIGSGNSLIKDAISRDKIASMEPDCFCLEMEAAGLMNTFPCIVIRGICDYADSHKNDNWQRYAAAMSAAYAKELLYGTPVIAVEELQPAANAIQALQIEVSDLHATLQQARNQEEVERLHKKISMLYTCPYAERKDRNIQIVEGTCKWFLNHDRFRNWLDSKSSSLLWTSADPGCGKSVLARHLVDVILPQPSRIVAYFFFKDDFLDQRTSANALCAVLHQLFQQAPSLFRESVLKKLSIYGERIKESFSQLWEIFLDVISHAKKEEIVCVIDALDECLEGDRAIFIDSVTKLALAGRRNPIKFLLTSRPYDDIRRSFYNIESLMPVIHLSGEGEKEIQEIIKEINIVVVHRVQQLSYLKRLQPDETEFLQEQLTSIPNRTYLWVHLVLDFIEKTPGFTRGHAKRCISALPRSVDEAYEKILSRTPDERAARKIFGFILSAYAPLTADEIGVLLALDKYKSLETLKDDLEPTDRKQATIRDICGLFITIVDSKVYLLHQTAREFLVLKGDPSVTASRLSIGSSSSVSSTESVVTWNWRRSISLRKSHRVFTMCCLQLLQWQATKRNELILHGYCAINWVAHFLESETSSSSSMTTMALEICQLKVRMTWLSSYLEAQSPGSPDNMLLKAIPTLSLAIYLNLTPLVQFLADTGSDLNTRNRNTPAPLWWAAKSGNTSVVELLLQSGATPAGEKLYPHGSPLCEAASRGYDAVVRLLLSYDTEIDLPDLTGQTAIHRAATAGHPSIVQILFEAGARLDIKDICGNDALLSAAMAGHTETVDLLLMFGAYRETRNNRDETPLFVASRNGHENVVKALLAFGLNANVETAAMTFFTGTGMSITDWRIIGASAIRYDDEIRFYTLDQYTNKTLSCMPKLHKSLSQEVENWLSILDIPVQEGLSLTPLIAACLHGHHDTVTTLLLYGANCRKHVDLKGCTLLHLNQILRQHSIVKLLLEAGADIYALAESFPSPLTPREIVRSNGHTPTFKLFQEHDYKLTNGAENDFWHKPPFKHQYSKFRSLDRPSPNPSSPNPPPPNLFRKLLGFATSSSSSST